MPGDEILHARRARGERGRRGRQEPLQSRQVSGVLGDVSRPRFETRGPALPEGDAGLTGITYRLAIRNTRPAGSAAAGPVDDLVWTVRGAPAGGRGGRGGAGATPRYTASGPGVSAAVTVKGNTVSFQGTLPKGFGTREKLTVAAGISSGSAGGAADDVAPQDVNVSGLPSPQQDLSSLARQDGPFATVFESFHYLKLPNPRSLSVRARCRTSLICSGVSGSKVKIWLRLKRGELIAKNGF